VCSQSPEAECDKVCPGNEDESCGGARRMNIYKMGFDWKRKVASESNHVPNKDHTTNSGDGHYIDLLPMSPKTASSVTYQGCYIDTNDRLLDDLKYRNGDNSVENCIAECRKENYLLSGVQNGYVSLSFDIFNLTLFCNLEMNASVVTNALQSLTLQQMRNATKHALEILGRCAVVNGE
jgi:hypothetical protein